MKTHLLLQKYFERKRKSSQRFSQRALASRLGISASFLSRLISGKKPIPLDLLPRLAVALDIEPELLLPADHIVERNKRSVARDSEELADRTIATTTANQILRNWYYIPILELTTLSNFDGSLEMIAARLKLSKQTTEVAVRELLSLGLLRLDQGKYRKTTEKLRIASAKSLPAIRKFHDDMLEKSQILLRTELGEEAFQKRLITGITVSANPAKIKAAKARLAEFLYELANDLISDNGTEVYHLSAQLFPLTEG